MANDHRALPQRGGQRRATMGRMTREDKIGGGWQHVEAEPVQSAAEPLPAVDHASPALLKIGVILQRSDGAGLGRPAQRIAVEAVLHPGERLDQVGVADRNSSGASCFSSAVKTWASTSSEPLPTNTCSGLVGGQGRP